MADLAPIVASYALISAGVRAKVLDYVQRVWANLDRYRDEDIDRFVAAVTPVIVGGQLQMGALTDAYLASIEAATLKTTVRPIGVPQNEITDLRGVPTSDVYQRAGVTTWTALANGDDLDNAVAKGLDRALSLAATDLQMAKSHASRYVLDRRPSVVGYRRELTGRKSCGLCAVATTQRYHKADLMPIHPHCDCAVMPLYGTHDPGQVIDEERLADVHSAIADRFGVSDPGARDLVDYRQALIVHEHGEIGPVLAIRGQSFTGPGDL